MQIEFARVSEQGRYLKASLGLLEGSVKDLPLLVSRMPLGVQIG